LSVIVVIARARIRKGGILGKTTVEETVGFAQFAKGWSRYNSTVISDSAT